MGKINLNGFDLNDIASLISPWGFSQGHAFELATSIYRRRFNGISSQPKLPGALLSLLEEKITTIINYPVKTLSSSDGTRKLLFKNTDDQYFESVLIPDSPGTTVCISSQSGCRMACPFCVTGAYGYHGDLSCGDMVNQVLAVNDTMKLTHVVFMGMGEPLDNLEAVLKACRIFTADWGFSISPRNITVSTIGITPAIRTFLGETSCNLTVSVYSPFPEERSRVIPAEKRYPLSDIVDLLRSHPAKKHRRFSVAYMMIKDINDSERHLSALKDLLSGTGIRVNLLPFHSVEPGRGVASPKERMYYFKHELIIAGISASVRRSRGEDISAACGLLASGLKNGNL
jgi:23S rRNA (adenine2503-C2)-methyltransferase